MIVTCAHPLKTAPRPQGSGSLWFKYWSQGSPGWGVQLKELAKLEPKARKDPKGPQIAENMGRTQIAENIGEKTPGWNRVETGSRSCEHFLGPRLRQVFDLGKGSWKTRFSLTMFLDA